MNWFCTTAKSASLLGVTMLCFALSCSDGEAYSRGATSDPRSGNVDSGEGTAPALGPWQVQGARGARMGPFHPSIRHVLLISVDGLAARFLEQLLDEQRLPTFALLKQRGACTTNARTDTTHTNTLPNHTSMLTGLPVLAPPGFPREAGHGYTINSTPTSDTTVHNTGNTARSYTPSVFDVVHDHGLSTAMFASKSKFSLYENSYNAGGAPDLIGADDGNAKIDWVELHSDIRVMTDTLILTLRTRAPNFTFVHFNQPDQTGHALGWGSDEYLSAVVSVDDELGRLLNVIDHDPTLAGRTAIIVTTDHGGTGLSHLEVDRPENFVIPFFVLAPGVPVGRDLYALLETHRTTPGGDLNPSYAAPAQPIRNGDSGNLALAFLGLGPIPGSLMNAFGLPTSPLNDTGVRPTRDPN